MNPAIANFPAVNDTVFHQNVERTRPAGFHLHSLIFVLVDSEAAEQALLHALQLMVCETTTYGSLHSSELMV